jgi:hypothetical protein
MAFSKRLRACLSEASVSSLNSSLPRRKQVYASVFSVGFFSKILFSDSSSWVLGSPTTSSAI